MDISDPNETEYANSDEDAEMSDLNEEIVP